ncbi:MAG TPA: serine hydrolase [Longimicrobiales bacterium]|nr:serine hydrolase [Longimicrobiales bacterium]
MRFLPALMGVATAAALLGTVADRAAAQKPLNDLRPALEARIAKHKGTVGLALLDPKTGELLSIHGDETFPTASVIKVPILVTLFHRIDKGDLKLSDPVVMLGVDRMPGSGVLQYFDVPHQLTVKDAATLMIALSDNTATNLVIDKVGIRTVNARMDTLGLPHTKLWAKVFQRSATTIAPDSSAKYGLGVTTPVEIAKLLGMIYKGEAVSADASKTMLGMLDDQFYGLVEIPRYMPPDVKVAHKTGEDSKTRNDVAIVRDPKGRDYILAVLTKNNADDTWRLDNEAAVLIGDLARIVQGAMRPATAAQ